jgi:hypothetical protein
MAFEIISGVHLPVGRLIVAAALVLIGARIVAHAWARRRAGVAGNDAVFANRTVSPRGAPDRDARFEVVFGRGTLDLTGITEPEHDVTIIVETLFGNTLVKVPPDLAYDVEGSSTFGAVRMPDRSMATLGTTGYRTTTEHPSRLHLRVNAAFGGCRIVTDEPPPPPPPQETAHAS